MLTHYSPEIAQLVQAEFQEWRDTMEQCLIAVYGPETGRQEAEAATKLMDSLTQLKVRYRNDLAQAVAQGEFERAEALLAEYRKEEESRVSTAREQADEDYRSYESQVKAQSESYERARRRAETLAEFGDFSGYRALGYTDSEIRTMYDAWRAKNDDLAARMGL